MRNFLWCFKYALGKGDYDTLGVLLTSLIIDGDSSKYNHPDCEEQTLIKRLSTHDVDGLMQTYNTIIELCGCYSRISRQVIAFNLARRKIIGDYIYTHYHNLTGATLKQLRDKHTELKEIRSAKRTGLTPGFVTKQLANDCYKVFNHCNKDIKNYSVEEEFNIKPRVIFEEEINPNIHKVEAMEIAGDMYVDIDLSELEV